MFRFLARRTYKKMMVEEFIREQAKVRVITVAAFKGVSGPSQLNKLAEQMVQEHWDWCRATKYPIGQSLTLSALEEAVNAETLDLRPQPLSSRCAAGILMTRSQLIV